MGPIGFYQAVRNKGRWDYKQQSRTYQDFGILILEQQAMLQALVPFCCPVRVGHRHMLELQNLSGETGMARALTVMIRQIKP